MVGISRSDAVGSARAGRSLLTDGLRQGPDETGGGVTRSSLDRLLARGSSLERMAVDAGPLGKFRMDAQDALPSGTSAFTARAADTLVRVASRFDMTMDRLMQGNPQLLMLVGTIQPSLGARIEAAMGSIIEAQAVAAGATRRDQLDRLTDPSPAIATDTGLDGARSNTAVGGAAASDGAAPAEGEAAATGADASSEAPVEAPRDLGQILRVHGLEDLMADDLAIRSPFDAPPGAVLVYENADLAALALELRTAGGFASEAIFDEPLTGGGMEGNGYRLSAVFQPVDPTQPAGRI